MYKSYTVKAFKFKEISCGKGTISYRLVDELGDERIVTARAKCGLIKKIKSVEAIYHRETPLVEALANASINDVISIDFSDFNREYPRVHVNSKQEKMARGTVKDINNAQPVVSLDALNIDAFRLMQLLAISCAIFAIYALLTN